MQANQRLYNRDGYQVMLFPMEYMNISQGEGGSLSHNLAMDFLGWNADGRVYDCPYYAPCSCTSLIAWGTSDNRTYQSIGQVDTPNGLKIVTFCFNHDENPPAVGTTFQQGDLIGHSGTAGGVGDHMHFNTAYGVYDGYVPVTGTQYYELKNSSHIYETCYTNGTTIIDGNFYNWLVFQGGSPTPPVPPKGKHQFPWVLYARKLRES